MSIPAPGTDEDATPIFGIRKPNSLMKAKWIGRAIGRIADDVESALSFFGLPPVVGAGTVVAASSGARDAHWGVPVTAADRLALQALGATTIRTDLGITETYLAALDDGGVGSNPGGMRVAGWYAAPNPRHAEWSSVSASSASGSSSSVGNLVVTTAMTTDTAFATVATNKITVVSDGIYALDCSAALPASPTGLYWVQAIANGVVYKVYGSNASGSLGGSFFAALKLPAGTQITLEFFHQSAASRVLTGVFALTRIG
jgi:hypothetical protein